MFMGRAYPAIRMAWFESMTASYRTVAQQKRATPLCQPGPVKMARAILKWNILMMIFTTWLCLPSDTNSRHKGGEGERDTIRSNMAWLDFFIIFEQ